MSKNKTKAEIQSELEQAYKRIAELESAANGRSDTSEPQKIGQFAARSEAHIRELLDATPDAMVIVDVGGKILMANAQTEKLFGYVQSELVGAAVETLIPVPMRNGHVENRARFMEHPSTVTTGMERDISAERKNGEKFPVEISLSHHNLAGGEAVVLCAIRDVTERWRARELITAQRDLARLISVGNSHEFPWAFCLQAALRASKMDSGGIYFFDEQSRSFELVHHQGLGEEFVKAVKRFGEDTPSAKMVLSGRTVYFMETDLSEKDYHRVEGLHSLAVIPIQHHGQVLGCLNIASHTLPGVPGWARGTLETLAVEIGNIVIHHRTEESLKASRAQLNQALVAARMGTWRYHIPTARIEWSPEAAQIVGSDVNQSDFSTLLTHFHPDDRERIVRSLQEVLAQKKILKLEYRMFDANGNIRWITNYGHVECDTDGKPLMVVGLVQDITERKQMENTLEAEAIRRQILFEEAPDGILIIDSQTAGFLEFNTAAHTQLGYTREEFAKLHIYDVEAQETANETRSHIGEVMRNGRADFETLQRTKQGEIRNIHVTAQVMEILGEQVYYCVWRDITEHRRAEEARRQSHDLLAAAEKLARIGGWEWNVDRRTMTWTEETYYLHGMKPGELASGSPDHIDRSLACYDPSDRTVINDAFLRCIEEGISYDMEFPLTRFDGQRIWIRTKADAVKDGERVIRVVGNIQDITERKQAEQALRFSEAKWHSLFETCPAGIALANPQGEFLDANPAYLAQLGYTRDEIAKMQYHDYTPSKWHEQEAKNVAQLKATGLPAYFEKEHIRKDGTVFPVALTGWIIRDANGVPGTMGVFVQDISERKHAEEALRESETRYRLLVETSIEGIWSMDREHRTTYVNQSMADMLGYEPSEMLGRKVEEFFFQEDMQFHQTRMEKRHSGQDEVYERRFRRRDGSQLWTRVSARVQKDSQGNFNGSFAMFTDITERKRAEEALHRSQALLTEAQRIGRIGHMEWSEGNQVLTCSEEIYSILGLPCETVITQETVAAMMTEEERDRIRQMDMQALQQRQDMNYEYRLRRKDGSERWLHQMGKITYGENGAPVRMMAIIQDITERKQAEEQLSKNERILRLFVEHTPAAIAMFDREMRYIVNSARYLTDFRLGDQDLSGRSHYDVFPEMGEERKEIHRRCLSGAVVKNEADMLPRADGTIDWVRYELRPWYEANGEIGGLIFFSEVITERKQAEDALRESRSRIEMALKGANAAMWDWNVQTGETVFNERWAEMLGYTLEELEPVNIQTWINLCHPDDLKVSEFMLQRHFAGETEYYECEARMRHKNGSWVWVIDHGRVMEWDADGKPRRMFGTHLDITGRKREERYTQARLNLANLSYETLGMDMLMRTMLDEAEALTDSQIAFFHFVDDDQNTISLQAWSTNTLESLCTAEGKGQHYPVAQAGVWADGFRSGEPRIYNDYASLPHRRGLPEGHAPVTRLISLPIKRNNLIVAAIGVGNKPADYNEHDLEMVKRLAEDAFDIVLRKRAEEALRESERKLSTLLSNLIGFAYRCRNDRNWSMTFISSGCIAITGYSPEDLVENRALAYNDLIHPSDREMVWETIQKALNMQAPFQVEYRMITRAGIEKWVWEQGRGIFEEGELKALEGFITDITDRKRAGEALRESEEKYRGLMESLDNAVSTVDFDGRFLYMNDMAAEKLGGTPQEFIGRSMKELFPEPLASLQLAGIQNIFRINQETVLEAQSGGKSGVPRWYRFALQPLHDEAGRVAQVLINATDIHDLKTAQQELQELNRTLEEKVAQRSAEVQDLYNNAPTGYHSLDTSGNFVMVNQTELNWLGYSREEVIGRAARDFMTEESKNTFRKNFPLFLQRGWLKDLELEFIRKDGSILPVSLNATAVHDKDGKFVMSRSTLFDITARKLAERTLRESEEHNRLLFEESPVPVTLLDETGHIVRVNRAYEQLTGIPRYVLYGKTSEEMGLVDAQVVNGLTEAMLHAISKQEEFAIMEHTLTSADGTKRIVESRIFLLPINSVNHILITSNDISTHKKAEETLRHANVELERAMRMKDEFLATMSHELRTPLTGILGLSEALQLEIYGKLSDKQLKTVRNIENSGRHLLTLINDVLDLSKIEAGKLDLDITHCSLEDICQASLQLTKGMAHQKRQNVRYAAPAESIAIEADPRRIKQVLVNLLSNAIKFTSENGELGLTVEPDRINQKVRLVVWDKGIGIKPENLSKLFQPFTQIDGSLAREYSGTGLGLALVRRLVELHNGDVKVESVFGEGSRFIISLPWKSQETPVHAPGEEDGLVVPPLEADENVSQPMVLIADDNVVLLEMVGDFLEAGSYRTTRVQSGQELLERIESVRPDIILMDIQMPGMDGLETIRRVRENKNAVIASTPIIAVTALAMPEDRDLCLEAGANDYISKPVRLRELTKVIEDLLSFYREANREQK